MALPHLQRSKGRKHYSNHAPVHKMCLQFILRIDAVNHFDCMFPTKAIILSVVFSHHSPATPEDFLGKWMQVKSFAWSLLCEAAIACSSRQARPDMGTGVYVMGLVQGQPAVAVTYQTQWSKSLLLLRAIAQPATGRGRRRQCTIKFLLWSILAEFSSRGADHDRHDSITRLKQGDHPEVIHRLSLNSVPQIQRIPLTLGLDFLFQKLMHFSFASIRHSETHKNVEGSL